MTIRVNTGEPNRCHYGGGSYGSAPDSERCTNPRNPPRQLCGEHEPLWQAEAKRRRAAREAAVAGVSDHHTTRRAQPAIAEPNSSGPRVRTPTIFVCVYRRHVPSSGEQRQTAERARSDLRLERYLAEYWRDDRYYDWGDDPGFFCARDAFGDARRASWGVCRSDVRAAVSLGDAVAFFIGKPAVTTNSQGIRVPTGPVDYFYVGCGTVLELVDRERVWGDSKLAPYRDFYNVLARPGHNGGLENIEVFPRHDDWERRAAAPMVLFDPDRSWFDLDTPRHVARFTPERGVPEHWHADPTSRRLEGLLFGGVQRRLRTSHTGYGHAKRVIRLPASEFASVRDELLRIARNALD